MPDVNIPVPLTNGTAQGGPNGTPPVQAPAQAAPASETPNLSTAVMQDVVNKPSLLPTIPSGTVPKSLLRLLGNPRPPRHSLQPPLLRRMRCIEVCINGHFQF